MDEEFDVDLEARGSELWVLPTGDLDLMAAPEMQETLRLALASDASAIVVDLRGLELLDSTGLGVLIGAHAGEAGERLEFVAGSELIQGVLRISGLHDELAFRPAEA